MPIKGVTNEHIAQYLCTMDPYLGMPRARSLVKALCHFIRWQVLEQEQTVTLTYVGRFFGRRIERNVNNINHAPSRPGWRIGFEASQVYGSKYDEDQR